MATFKKGIRLERLEHHPLLSLTHVRWITEIQDPDDEDAFESVEMFDVVGEQHRTKSILSAAMTIAKEGTFQPARFWLMPDDENEHDDQAVKVYATAKGRAFHVGFLPRRQAKDFRSGMLDIDRDGESLEVLGCITSGKSASHPNARLYLPATFADDVQSGYVDDSDNHPEWLTDTSPIPRRPPARRADAFTDIELCKIYCLFAKTKLWINFPGEVEGRAEAFRSRGLGSVGESLSLFYDDPYASDSLQDESDDDLNADSDEDDFEDDDDL